MVNRENRKLNADITNNMERRLESSGKKNSTWVSPKPVYRKLAVPDNSHSKRQTMNFRAPSKSHLRSTGEMETSTPHALQSVANQVLDFKCNEQKEKLSDEVICGENKKNDAARQEHVPDKVVVDMPNQNSRGCETLKLKLWEILGAVSSPNIHCSNSQGLNVASKSLHSELKHDTHSKPEGGAKQNSDTIESDTQDPTLRRSITQSLAREKAPRSKRTIKRRNSPTTCYKDHKEKDIFSFNDGWPWGLSDALNDGLPTSKGKKVTSQSYGAEKCETFVLKADNAHSNNESQYRSKALSSKEKSTSRGNSMPFKPKNLDKDFCQTEPRRMEEVTKYVNTPNLQQSVGQPEVVDHSCFKNKVLKDASTCSPSFKMNSTVRRSTLSPPTIRDVQNLDKHGSRERIVNTKGTQSLNETYISTRSSSTERNTPLRRSPLASPIIRKVQDVHEQSSGKRILNTKGMQSLKGYLGSLKYSHADSRPEVNEDCPSGSSSEEDLEKSEDSLDERGYQLTQIASPYIRNDENPNSFLPLHKMFSNQKGIRTNKRSASASSKGSNARRKLMRQLEQNQDDGLTSAIALFSLALERLRGKVKSITQKKSTEILMSVADEIYLLFQNAEKKIQADMENTTDHARTKRKQLETQIEDLQGQLTSIYERFKQEINQHVQDYKDTLEGSDALKVELRGSMEKQRALHRELLSQAEEAIVSKLGDAQTRIDTVHNLGKGEMVQLKNILAEALRDSVLV